MKYSQHILRSAVIATIAAILTGCNESSTIEFGTLTTAQAQLLNGPPLRPLITQFDQCRMSTVAGSQICMLVMTDPETQCEYIVATSSSTYSTMAITPRLKGTCDTASSDDIQAAASQLVDLGAHLTEQQARNREALRQRLSANEAEGQALRIQLGDQ